MAEWEKTLRPVRLDRSSSPRRLVSKKHATLTVQPDGSVLATGDKPNNDVYEIDLETDLKGITALRLEVLNDPSLPEGGPGRAPLFQVGDFLLTEFLVTAAPAAERREAAGRGVPAGDRGLRGQGPLRGAGHRRDHRYRLERQRRGRQAACAPSSS